MLDKTFKTVVHWNANHGEPFSRLKHLLPAPVVRFIRAAKDRIASSGFSPYVAVHRYGDAELSIHIDDKISALWYDRDWAEMPEIAQLKKFGLKPGARVFDLGAHQGIVALMLSRIVGPNGSVIALEPGQKNFEISLKNKRANDATNLSILCAVASDKSGEMSFSEGINGRVGSGVTRPAYSIDDLSIEFGIPNVVMVDIEGYELKALMGAIATLAAGPDWFIEVHAGCGLEDAGGSATEVVLIFQSAGYYLFVQDDERYTTAFRPFTTIPSGRFFLIATR